MNQDTEVSIFPYVVRFSIAYAIALIIFAVITKILDIDSGTVSSIGALLIAVVMATSKFVKDQERVPSQSERNRLTWSSLGASMLVSAILIVSTFAAIGQLDQIPVFLEVFSQLHTGIVLTVFLIITAMYTVVLWFAYGWFAKMQYNLLLRKKDEI